VGYELDPEHWGCGYMTEAMERMLVFATDVEGLARLVARVVCTNERSLRLLRRLGFECAETIPAGPGKDGTEWPQRYLYRLSVAR
jgi:RimJ/RimL family protein N-acetyltransferase